MTLQRYFGAAWAAVHGPHEPHALLRWICESKFLGVVPGPAPRAVDWPHVRRLGADFPVRFPAVRCSAIVAETPSTAGLGSQRDGDRRAAAAAVEQAARTAAGVAAQVLIVEPGIVPLFGDIEAEDLGDPNYQWTKERVDALAARRKAALEPALDAACRSLHALARALPDFTICLTQSRSLRAVASLDGLAFLYEDLAQLRLGYWHDAAIAARREQTLGEPQGAWLETFGSRCMGCSLGDASEEGLYLPPGSGAVDYPLLASYLRPQGRSMIGSLELDPSTSPGELPGIKACLDKFGL